MKVRYIGRTHDSVEDAARYLYDLHTSESVGRIEQTEDEVQVLRALVFGVLQVLESRGLTIEEARTLCMGRALEIVEEEE